MHKSGLFISALLMLSITTLAQVQTSKLGVLEATTDVGAPKNTGSTSYNATTQQYTLTGSGTNMWGEKDEFHFAYKKLKGDFILRAHVKLIGEGVDPHRKIGWSVRPTLEGNGTHVSAELHGDGLTSLQSRSEIGGITESLNSTDSFPDVIQLERKAGTYIMSTAQYGKTFTSITLNNVDLGDEVFVGIFVCSHNAEVIEKAVFSNVRIVLPAPDDFTPYRDYIGSNLEVMDIATGQRKILAQFSNSIQAPNWTLDGKTLIYNSEGKLFNFDLATNTSSELYTGFATRNNNDHVLTFDGKTIGISHHSEDDNGQSIIYYLPTMGGDPVRVTPKGPSYFHGWSPDGKELVYTGGRNDVYNIYKISKKGGEETKLTDLTTLDDGPEYSPDGKYIYFNSTRSGKMKIWRMKPDGSEQQQMTFDEYNDWFPHISPDGKSMVIISYPTDIDPADHPFYKRVYLRIMPIEGGEPTVITYLYGGQGTINVPSWSPDGKKIAFVSNSQL